jgi:hypothetical protein
MKQGIVFAIATTVLVVTVAAAHVLAPLPDGTQRGSAKAATGTSEPLQTSTGQLQSAKPVLVETRQAPVPIVVRERPPVALPVVETASAKGACGTGAVAEAEGKGFAKGAIEADGYKSVRNITPGPDGTWRARALRGKTEVVITVDREGRVSAD